MKKQLLLILILLVTFSLKAQESDAKNIQHKIGTTISTSAGVGFSYLANIKDKHQIQVTFLPLYYDGTDFLFGLSDKNFINNLGLNYYHKIVNNDKFDILLFGGINHRLIIRTDENYVGSTNGLIESTFTETESKFNGTVGFAFEVGASDLCKLRWQVGYAAYNFNNGLSIAPSIGLGVDFLLH